MDKGQKKLSMTNRGLGFKDPSDFSDLDVQADSLQANNDKPHKKTNLLSFLEKIDEETLEVMNNFLEKNVSTINKHKPTKINLYEDIMMIIEYKKEEELLKKDKKKGSQAAIKRIMEKTERSKDTIKERVEKKIAKNISNQYIVESIKLKRDFCFNGKTLVPASRQDKNIQSKKDVKIEKQVKNQNKTQQNISPQFSLQSNVKRQQAPPIQSHMSPAQNKNKTGYKYGNKAIKERIFFYANKVNKEIISFTQSQYSKMMEQYKFEDILTKKASKQEPMILEGLDQRSNEGSSMKDSKKSIEELSNKMSGLELESFIKSIKQKAFGVLSNEAESSEESRNQLKNYIKTIETLEKKLLNQKNIKLNKQNEDSDISSQDSNDNKKEKEQKLNNSSSKKTNQPSNTPSKAEQQAQKLKKHALYFCNNNQKYLEMIKTNPQLASKYTWSDQEDNVLFSFRFNPEAYHNEMLCLHRYKNRDSIMERMKFLNISMDFKSIERVNNIEKASIVEEVMELQ